MHAGSREGASSVSVGISGCCAAAACGSESDCDRGFAPVPVAGTAGAAPVPAAIACLCGPGTRAGTAAARTATGAAAPAAPGAAAAPAVYDDPADTAYDDPAASACNFKWSMELFIELLDTTGWSAATPYGGHQSPLKGFPLSLGLFSKMTPKNVFENWYPSVFFGDPNT